MLAMGNLADPYLEMLSFRLSTKINMILAATQIRRVKFASGIPFAFRSHFFAHDNEINLSGYGGAVRM